eukprot:scaffold44518_cov16-Tisochrysis_lutea.AAC.2
MEGDFKGSFLAFTDNVSACMHVSPYSISSHPTSHLLPFGNIKITEAFENFATSHDFSNGDALISWLNGKDNTEELATAMIDLHIIPGLSASTAAGNGMKYMAAKRCCFMQAAPYNVSVT